MSLLTTCPRCASQFRIKPEQLAAGGGWVQCGVCGALFDARAALIPEDAPEAPASVEDALPAAPLSAPAPGLAAEPPPASSPGDAEAAMPAGIVSRQAGGADELNSIIVVDPDAPLPEEPESLPVILPPPEPVPKASPGSRRKARTPPGASCQVGAIHRRGLISMGANWA